MKDAHAYNNFHYEPSPSSTRFHSASLDMSLDRRMINPRVVFTIHTTSFQE